MDKVLVSDLLGKWWTGGKQEVITYLSTAPRSVLVMFVVGMLEDAQGDQWNVEHLAKLLDKKEGY